jgi:CRP/FNR family transcriptional regulator, cyclic AMP receptor protein
VLEQPVSLHRPWQRPAEYQPIPATGAARALARFGPGLGKDGKHEPVIPKISQETLAEMVGTTRSRVSFFMNKFRALGFIHYNDRLEVHSSLLSVVLRD